MIPEEMIEGLLDEIKIPYRYHHFEEDEAVSPPFICWLIPKTNNFGADGKVYHRINALDIELYTDQKDFELEKKIEEQLDEKNIFWEKTEEYIKSENMYEVLYEMEV
jgi:hypothetical protein